MTLARAAGGKKFKWKEFESGEAEERVAVFMRTLDDKELMTDDALVIGLSILRACRLDVALGCEAAGK